MKAGRAIRRAETTEFSGLSRCKACIKNDRKCYAEPGLNGCIWCDNYGSPCVFTRTVTKTAPCGEFAWGELIQDREHQQPEFLDM